MAASEAASAAGEQHDLTMEQLVALAEFDTDAEAVDRLTQTATKDPSRFGHVLAGLRRTRDDRAAYEKAARQITESGVPLDELENGWWLPAGGAWLSELFSP